LSIHLLFPLNDCSFWVHLLISKFYCVSFCFSFFSLLLEFLVHKQHFHILSIGTVQILNFTLNIFDFRHILLVKILGLCKFLQVNLSLRISQCTIIDKIHQILIINYILFLHRILFFLHLCSQRTFVYKTYFNVLYFFFDMFWFYLIVVKTLLCTC